MIERLISEEEFWSHEAVESRYWEVISGGHPPANYQEYLDRSNREHHERMCKHFSDLRRIADQKHRLEKFGEINTVNRGSRVEVYATRKHEFYLEIHAFDKDGCVLGMHVLLEVGTEREILERTLPMIWGYSEKATQAK